MAGFWIVMGSILLVILFLIGLFIFGLILLIVGLVTKKKPKNQGKKAPKVCIVIGSVFMGIPTCITLWLVISSAVNSASTSIKRKSYENVTDKWRNESVMSERREADDVVAEMLKTADSDDSEGFAKFFTPNLQKGENFKDDLDKFFETYPKGLAECELEGGSHGSSGSYNYGESVQHLLYFLF